MKRSPLWLVVAMLFPTLALLAVFNFLPAVMGLQRAFTHWEVGEDPRWNGVANFQRMAGDDYLRLGFGNLLMVWFAGLFKALVPPLLVAEGLLSLRSVRWQWALRTLLTLPMVVPGMVVMLLWGFLYDGSSGLINAALEAMGLGRWTRAWLGSTSTALPALLAIGFPWAGGLSLLVYLAGLGAIDPQIHDAASLDGAVGWRRVLRIDIPLVRPQIGLLATLATIGALQDFGTILVLTGGGPGLSTHVPALHMYFQAFRFGHLGYASAIGFVLFAAILSFTAIGRRLGGRAGGVA